MVSGFVARIFSYAIELAGMLYIASTEFASFLCVLGIKFYIDIYMLYLEILECVMIDLYFQ